MHITEASHSSTLSRYFALCYSIVILIVSLYPFTGWRITGVPVLDFYTYPWPYYQTTFDNGINFLAYAPLGFAIAMNTRKRWLKILAALCWGLSLSSSIEFIQQFLPSRIASNVDILSNTLGAFMGALLAMLIPWQSIQHSLRIRHMWLRSSQWVDMGTVWLGLWLLTQLDPAIPLFSLVNTVSDLPQPIKSPLANLTIFLTVLEASSVFLHGISVALFASCLVRHRFAIASIIWLTVALGFVCKMSMAILMLRPVQFFTWLNLNVLLGGLAAIWALTLLLHLSSRTRALVGCATLLLSLIGSWIWPISPSFSATLSLFDWEYGHLSHFRALTSTVRELWSYGALIILFGVALRYR